MTDPTTLPDRALSIRQPWAWAILNAGKRVENRPRRFNYRGPICIHASLADIRHEFSSYRWCIADVAAHLSQRAVSTKEARNPPPTEADLLPNLGSLQRGGIIGTAEIVDCVESHDSPWFFGPYGLVLKNVQPVEFVPVKGALGLFDWRKKL